MGRERNDWPIGKGLALVMVAIAALILIALKHPNLPASSSLSQDKVGEGFCDVHPDDPLCKSGARTAQAADQNPMDTKRIDPKPILMGQVELKFSWYKEAFDTVMIASFTITNPTEYGFKDFEVTCTHSAPSGTTIDSNTRTIYQAVLPRSTKRVRDFDMGFINSQATSSYCRITNLVPVYVPEETKSAKKKQRRQASVDSNLPLEERGGWVVPIEER